MCCVATRLERKLTFALRIAAAKVTAKLIMGNIKKAVKQKTCSKCGDSFDCGAEGGEERCWCDALPHLPLASIAGRDCFCPPCLSDAIQTALQPGCPAGDRPLDSARSRAAEPVRTAIKTDLGVPTLLLEGEDYYSDGGMIVFTASYHRRRGYCCESGCRHCPYKD